MAEQDVKPVIDHLFRHESGKLVSVLTRLFGTHNLELAEDVVQDTLLKALEHWKFHGVPDNPSAWLFATARNKALDVVRRVRYQKEFAEEVSALLKSEYSAAITLQQRVNEQTLEDEQLRMMFVCCHPSVPEESQVAMMLKTLCGFSTAEIAKAFLTNEETISKRLYRARQQFHDEKISFVLPPAAQLQDRLDTVLTAIYLIFNEGYNSTRNESIIRDDLVEEALRLGHMLTQFPTTSLPKAHALLAMMCFQAARLYGRIDADGNLLSLKEQDRKKWNRELIEKGEQLLRRASEGEQVSSYHLEAAISREHCTAATYADTSWSRILQLYDWLYTIKPDPLIALNRLIAIAETEGPEKALSLVHQIEKIETIKEYYLYPATLGEWHRQLGDVETAKKYFEQAIELTQSNAEKNFLKKKIAGN